MQQHGDGAGNSETRGARLLLRQLAVGDVGDDYVRWMNDPAINRYLESRWDHHDRASLTDFVTRVTADPDTYPFAIVRHDNQRHIGNIKLGPVDRRHRRGSIGILIGDRESWGLGFGTEAIELMVGFAFEELALHKLTAGCYSTNVGSIRAFEKAGFNVEAVLPSHFESEGGYVDGVLLGLINGAPADPQ